MIEHGKLEKPRTPKRFYFITALIYLPIFFCLTIIRAQWFGYVIAVLSFGLLLWMRHTRLWKGLRIVICFSAAFLVAFSGLYFSRPQQEVSFVGQVGRETLRFFLHLPVSESVRTGESLSAINNWQPPEGYDWRSVSLGQCSLELLSRQGAPGGRALLQLHGGAFVTGLNDLYRTFAKRYTDMLGGGTVATLDYRLYPRAPYPAQQEDAMAAWQYLTQTMNIAPKNILLAGDSAGGNLVLSLCLKLRDAGQPLPGGLICMSPWADLSTSGPSHLDNATSDPTFGVTEEEFTGKPVGVKCHYADLLNAYDPDVSPSFGNFAGFPPMLLQVSSNEVLLSDSEMVADNARQHGVDCTITVYEDMFHVFQGMLDLTPESKKAWEEIGAFIKRVGPER